MNQSGRQQLPQCHDPGRQKSSQRHLCGELQDPSDYNRDRGSGRMKQILSKRTSVESRVRSLWARRKTGIEGCESNIHFSFCYHMVQ